MTKNRQDILSIEDIRARLVGVIKDWGEQTSDLTWPEGDSSMAAMDTHVFTLRAVNGQLALAERKLPRREQESLAFHFNEASVQDPEQFAPFAAAVRLAIAA